jgi:1-phosphatidylinositol phosphodiesterase
VPVRAGMLVVAMSAISVALATPASAHATDGYSHDSTIGTTNTDWMSWLPSGASLSELSIPGTHDTGAYKAGGDIVLTQSMDLPEQLKSGIRAWDIRLGKDSDGRLKVYHGISKQGQDFENEVLATASGFLDAHPTEVILMRIKHETGPSEGFDTLVKSGLDKYSRVYRGIVNNPALRDIRGKIVVLQQFTSSTRLGIPWSSLAVQDDYYVRTNWDLANKWRAVKGQLDAAQSGPWSTTYVNFLSGSIGSFPYFVASGHSSPQTGAPNLLTGLTRGFIDTCSSNPQCIPEFPSVGCVGDWCSVAFEGVNVLTMNELNRRGKPNRFGVVYADFPGRGLVQAVIAANDFRGVLKGQESGRCVDVPDASQQNNTAVQLWDCWGGANQSWTATPSGQLTIYGTKCLDVRAAGNTDGTPVQIYDCNGTGAQQWKHNADGSVVNTPTGKCLDAFANGTTNGTALVIWTCNNGANQKWARG